MMFFISSWNNARTMTIEYAVHFLKRVYLLVPEKRK